MSGAHKVNPNIALVDDHSIVIAGIQMLLKSNLPAAKVFEANNSYSLEEILKVNRCDLVVLDINIPGTDTYDLVISLLDKYKDLKILIYTMSPDEIYAHRYLKLGISGFLSKEAPLTELLKAIHTILSGRKFFSEKTLQIIADRLVNGDEAENIFDRLTPREFEIMKHLLKGTSSKDIASGLNLHSSTIGTYKSRIFDKLKVQNIVELKELAQVYKVSI